MIHRVDAWDAALAGVLMHHPDTGAKIAPEQHRTLAPDKTAWDRNYGIQFIAGGTAAISLSSIARAMEQGQGQCIGVNITEPITL